jgi:hypothetical protein
VLAVGVHSTHVEHPAFSSLLHRQLVHCHHYLPQLLQRVLVGLSGDDLALGGRQSVCLKELVGGGSGLAVVLAVVLFDEGVEVELRLVAVVDDVLHVVGVAVFADERAVGEFSLDAGHFLLAPGGQQFEPRLRNEDGEFVLVLVLHLLQVRGTSSQQALVLAADDPEALEEGELCVFAIELLSVVDHVGGEVGVLQRAEESALLGCVELAAADVRLLQVEVLGQQVFELPESLPRHHWRRVLEVDDFLEVGESPADVDEIVGVGVVALEGEVVEDELPAAVAECLVGDGVAVAVLLGAQVVFLWCGL